MVQLCIGAAKTYRPIPVCRNEICWAADCYSVKSNMSRSRGTSRTRSYGEVTQYKFVTSAQPVTRARSRSRGRADASDEYCSSQVTRSRSKSIRRPSEDTSNCVPCNLVALSSTLRKRLIVCCDGSKPYQEALVTEHNLLIPLSAFCGADKGKVNNPTNIARLSRAIANVGLDSKGVPIVQIVYYQSGVGTGKLTALNKATQGQCLV